MGFIFLFFVFVQYNFFFIHLIVKTAKKKRSQSDLFNVILNQKCQDLWDTEENEKRKWHEFFIKTPMKDGQWCWRAAYKTKQEMMAKTPTTGAINNKCIPVTWEHLLFLRLRPLHEARFPCSSSWPYKSLFKPQFLCWWFQVCFDLLKLMLALPKAYSLKLVYSAIKDTVCVIPKTRHRGRHIKNDKTRERRIYRLWASHGE